ncbi:MAG: galactose mutarotase [Cyclobacteriaceae bacterium]
MKISKSSFGTFEGQNVDLFRLENDKGMAVKITNYGGTITSIQLPLDSGIREVACGFDTLEGYFGPEYKANAPYFGCTVGRYCSQIKDAKFSLEGKVYQLAAMVGDNNLHGGIKGFDKQIWEAKEFESANGVGIALQLNSPDGQEGFPGNVEAKVTFVLTNANEIEISYEATTDKATPLSMTNHTYFNLSGFSEDVLNHVAKVNTDKRQEMDETGAGTGVIVELDGQPDDLSGGRRIGDVHDEMGDGFEHFYVFDKTGSDLSEVASVALGDLSLTVKSTEPCMLLYTGKYTSDELKRESGDQYGMYRGFCCETHRYQNGPNIPGSPGTITTPDAPFEARTVFAFNWK